jgi:hypothetical protein
MFLPLFLVCFNRIKETEPSGGKTVTYNWLLFHSEMSHRFSAVMMVRLTD